MEREEKSLNGNKKIQISFKIRKSPPPEGIAPQVMDYSLY